MRGPGNVQGLSGIQNQGGAGRLIYYQGVCGVVSPFGEGGSGGIGRRRGGGRVKCPSPFFYVTILPVFCFISGKIDDRTDFKGGDNMAVKQTTKDMIASVLWRACDSLKVLF